METNTANLNNGNSNAINVNNANSNNATANTNNLNVNLSNAGTTNPTHHRLRNRVLTAAGLMAVVLASSVNVASAAAPARSAATADVCLDSMGWQITCQ